MFSGFTNQVSSWMNKKQEEESAKPPSDSSPKVADDTIPEEKKEFSPTKSSRMDMLGNVKNQMTNWIGGGIASLRKASEGDAAAPTSDKPPDSPLSEASVKGSIKEKDDEDNSSATGGADSEVLISDDEEGGKDDGFATAAVSTKAIQGAKSLGNFLYSAVNKAGKTVSEAGVKIKKTVEENSILGEFNKEQEAFIKEKEGKGNGTAVPPWSGCPNEAALKEQCLALSTDKKNFVRSPPAGAEFQFDYEVSYPVAMATLAEDPNLEKMRFELVPKVINEEKFWRNYFYRVSLICQANELSSMASEEQESFTKSDDDNQPTNEREWEKELDEELQSFEVVNSANNEAQWKNHAEDVDSDEFPDLK